MSIKGGGSDTRFFGTGQLVQMTSGGGGGSPITFTGTVPADNSGNVSGYTVYVFTQTSKTYSIPYSSTAETQIYAMVVAGGGAGGAIVAAGGGGGGVVMTPINIPVGSDTMTINVGAGGVGYKAGVNGSYGIGTNGGNSTITFSNNTVANITAVGGGATSNYNTNGATMNGGSGGGGAGNTPGSAITTPGNYLSTVFYGNTGGQSNGYNTGGGGGAGAVGSNATASAGGNGGNGIKPTLPGINIFTPYNNYYFGSGGGGVLNGSYGAYAGGYNGGGGQGNYASPRYSSSNRIYDGQNASNNTGGGGGGGGNNTVAWANYGGDGGSGIVILAIPVTKQTYTSVNSLSNSLLLYYQFSPSQVVGNSLLNVSTGVYDASFSYPYTYPAYPATTNIYTSGGILGINNSVDTASLYCGYVSGTYACSRGLTILSKTTVPTTWTISMWFNTASVSGRLFQALATVSMSATIIAFYNFNGSKVWNFTPSSNIVTNKWYHLAFTYSGTVLYTYLNGVSLTCSSNNNTGLTGTDILYGSSTTFYSSKFYIGTSTNIPANDAFSSTAGAYIDEFRFYNGALTASQVLSIYNGTY